MLSNVVGSELIDTNNKFKHSGRIDKLKVCTLKGRVYLEKVKKCTRGRGSKNR